MIIVVCIIAALALLGYVLLSDSARFSDFAVVFKPRPKENNEPTQTQVISESPVKANNETEQNSGSTDQQEKTEDSTSPGENDVTKAGSEPEVNNTSPAPAVQSGNTGSVTSPPEQNGNTGSAPSGGVTAPAEPGLVQATTRAEIISYCENELEEMWEYYKERVEAMEQEAREEYRALPAEERTKDKKEEIVSSKMDMLYDLEDECDARVNELLTYVAAELRKIGEDTSIISNYRQEYADRKHAMESEYIKRFQRSVK